MGKISAVVDHHFSKRPYSKNEPCADLGYLKEDKDSLFFSIADVAGHGDQAHQLSLEIRDFFVKNQKNDLVALMKELHEFLKGTRGAVGLVGRLDKRTGALRYVGLGNISMRKISKKSDMRVLSTEGVIGYIIPTPKIMRLQLEAGETLLLYTDGIIDHFKSSECKGFFDKDAKHIVNGIMKHFYKGNDDAACIAIRYKND